MQKNHALIIPTLLWILGIIIAKHTIIPIQFLIITIPVLLLISLIKKIRFLGEQIKVIEHKIREFELERRKLLQNKECYIVELKNIINDTYQEDFLNTHYNCIRFLLIEYIVQPLGYFSLLRCFNNQ